MISFGKNINQTKPNRKARIQFTTFIIIVVRLADVYTLTPHRHQLSSVCVNSNSINSTYFHHHHHLATNIIQLVYYAAKSKITEYTQRWHGHMSNLYNGVWVNKKILMLQFTYCLHFVRIANIYSLSILVAIRQFNNRRVSEQWPFSHSILNFFYW